MGGSYSSSYGSSYGSGYGTSGPGAQAISSIITLLIVASTILLLQFIYYIINSKSLNFVTLLDKSVSSDSNMIVIPQDPNQKDAVPIGISVNERTGIEFAYSFFLFVNSSTFTGEDKLKHVFHKGFIQPWPLMGPAVFMLGTTNTMRVVMNTQTNPFTYVDITNIPVQKWVHVVLNCYKSGLDVYINGNLATRLPLKGTIPYQNFQNIVIFSQSTRMLRKSLIDSLPFDVLFGGAISGQLSALKYARYALSINEINSLMGQGPSKNVYTASMQLPPYNGDNWWVDQHTR
uniref:LamG-like jellyroll fold domain-containing protein n=1 Tax=viral metagenome TaxID=1070528 RepID=A0A6C0JYU8_9ZZZZ